MQTIWRGLLFATLAMPAMAQEVEVKLQLQADNALLVSYRLPQGCDRLPFQNPGAVVQAAAKIRKAWQPVDDCSVVSGDGVSRSRSSCGTVSFRVPPSSEMFDRVYPGSFPMGGGLYAHTWNYAVSNLCGPVRYRFEAPGSVGAKGKIYPGKRGYVSEAADAAEMPVLLLQSPLPPQAGPTAYLDPALGEATIEQIRHTSTEATRYFRKALPHATFREPILAATRVVSEGGPRYWGDGQDVLRLALYNWPDRAEGELLSLLNGFVAHEYAHRFQPEAQHDVYAGGDDILHEGSAELLQWLAGVETGWRSKADSAAMLDRALTRCQQQVGELPWQKLPLSRRNNASTIYPCGLVTQLFSLAARQADQPATALIDRYFAAGQRGEATGMAQAFECGNKADCKPRWLPRLLGDKDSMSQVWADLASQTGLIKSTVPSLDQQQQMLPQAFAVLMQEDCGGAVSFYTQPDGFLIASVAGCQSLREGMYIKAVAGEPLSDAARTLPLLTGCREQGKVTVQAKDGVTLSLTCQHPFNPPANFYAVDIDKLLSRLH